MDHPVDDDDAAAGALIRMATVADLEAINGVVERALMSWDLPERVKRLSLPVYRYVGHDFDAMKFMVAADAGGRVVGVAAWDSHPVTVPGGGENGLLLHGLYVEPRWHSKGVGTRLFAAVREEARELGRDGLLVRAQASARRFFGRMGMKALPATDEERDYANRYWLPLPSQGGSGE